VLKGAGIELAERLVANRLTWLGLFVIGVVVLVTYQPALAIGFIGDEWAFLQDVGTMRLPDDLIQLVNPIGQTYWYRPMQGIQYLLGYTLFHFNASGFHAIHILLHLANCWWLFGLGSRILRRWRAGLVAALFFAALSAYGWAVLWPADAAPVETFFSLAALGFWWRYLQREQRRDRLLAFCAFVLTLLTRESGVTLLVILFALDRLIVRKSANWVALSQRYAGFLIVLGLFLVIGLNVRLNSSSLYGIHYAYSLGTHVVTNLLGYLALLAYPWGLPAPFDLIWLGIALALFGYVVFVRRSARLLFLGLVAVVSILPFVPFRSFNARYLYLPFTVVALIGGLLLEHARRVFSIRRMYGILAAGAIGVWLVSNGLTITEKAVGMGDLSRYNRTLLQMVAQKHVTFPEDTYLYFINPIASTADLGGMFFMRYGAHVSVYGTDRASVADLRRHKNCFIYYQDEPNQWQEQRVRPEIAVRVSPALPVSFNAPMRLVGYDLADDQVQRGGAIVLLLYWQTIGKIDKDYTIFVHLVDSTTGETVSGFDSQPQDGRQPTTVWSPEWMALDAKVIPVPPGAPPGRYHLEIGLYVLTTMERLVVLDADGAPTAAKIVIEPIHIGE
jgi:hypothetical protein